MKYYANMVICEKDDDEFIRNIITPAEIKVECSYEIQGFCVYSHECDFSKELSEKDADILNNL